MAFNSYLHAIVVASLAAFAWAAHSFGAILEYVGTAWRYDPPDARASLALDRMARAEVDHRQPGIAARFAEFIRRALTHDDFAAGRYDPGWRLA